MWQVHEPKPVKLFAGILAANEEILGRAVGAVEKEYGHIRIVGE